MLITRRSDYAMRIFRALQDGKVHNVREICTKEDIPKAFAYKIFAGAGTGGFREIGTRQSGVDIFSIEISTT